MGYALLGHGSIEGRQPLEVDDSALPPDRYKSGMDIVAIDAGTTIQVYTDAGQALRLDEKELAIFSQLKAPWPPMSSRNVTDNMRLTSMDQFLALEAKEPGYFAKRLAPHIPLIAGKDIPNPSLLCTGTPKSCPTDPRMITGRMEGPRAHTCDGILGKYKGELLWVACTAVYTADEDVLDIVDAARGTAPESVIIGQDPDDPKKTWYAFEKDHPEGLLGWFDDQSGTVQDDLLEDEHIEAWHDALKYCAGCNNVCEPSKGRAAACNPSRSWFCDTCRNKGMSGSPVVNTEDAGDYPRCNGCWARVSDISHFDGMVTDGTLGELREFISKVAESKGA